MPKVADSSYKVDKPKDAMGRIPVVGTVGEKGFFVALYATAVLMFLTSAGGVISAALNAKVSTVDIQYRESVPFPGMFFCQQQPSGLLIDPVGTDTCPGLQLETYELGVSASGAGETLNTRCTAVNTDTATVRTITAFFAGFGTGYSCVTVNEDGAISSQRYPATWMKFTLTSTAHDNDELLAYAGFFDVGKIGGTFLELTGKNLNPNIITMVNSMSYFGFAMDTVTDLSDSFSYYPQTTGTAAQTTKIYRAKLETVPDQVVGHTHAPGYVPDQSDFVLVFRISDFMGRDVTIRRKAFTEIWAELGGVWSSSLLLLALFFARQSKQGDDGIVLEGNVLRLRGADARKTLLKELGSMGGEEMKKSISTPAMEA